MVIACVLPTASDNFESAMRVCTFAFCSHRRVLAKKPLAMLTCCLTFSAGSHSF